MADHELKIFTRRDLLKSAGLAGAAAVAPLGGVLDAGAQAATQRPAPSAGTSLPAAMSHTGDALEALTASERDTLDAMCARIIPSDASGPGAREAKVWRYIDRALGGALSTQREAYRTGLSSLDRYAQASRGKRFHELSDTDQDSVLIDVENGSATPGLFAGGSGGFFTMVRGHAMQGMFGDPYYGGNANFIGWDMIGYPGVRTTVTPTDQQNLEKNALKPNHRSAYDTEMFTKATVSIDAPQHPHGHIAHREGTGHGDEA